MILGLIGIGRWGKNIIATLEKTEGAKLKYLSARDGKSLASFGEQYEKLTDWREFLAKKDLEAILIATPASTHFELIKAAIAVGKHVFAEKPMVTSTKEAEGIRKLVAKSGKIFMVGYQYLFNENIRYLKREIEKGSFGKILKVESTHIVSPSRPDVDIFWDAAPHPLSIFQYFFNPKALLGTEGKIARDDASVEVTFKDSPELSIITSCGGKTKTRKLTVIGKKATAVLDETLAKNKLAITRNGKTEYPEIGSSEPLRNELEHFIHCIQTSKTPLTNINFGCQITNWLETIEKTLHH